MNKIFNYTGQGKSGKKIPDYKALFEIANPAHYIAEPALCDAVNVSIALGQPLIVTGEPGTGKTQLAASIAYEYDIPLLEFYTKTTSIAADLFYQYDAIRRFQDSQLPDRIIKVENYISYQALGVAILLTKRNKEVNNILPEEYRGKPPTRSVILIDEVDKAPRDLPNDILIEIERMQFKVVETGKTHIADPKYRPIVILTSNSEKNLPDAFLRRCVFYHTTFPDSETLKSIVKKRFEYNKEIEPHFSDDFIESAIDHFIEIRELGLRKKPSTAEFLAWITMLKTLNLDVRNNQKNIQKSYTVLAKNYEDLHKLINFLQDKEETKP